MTELEEKMLKLGYPEIDEIDSSTTCCDDKEVSGFSCEWRVERIVLPTPITSSGADGGFLSLGSDGGLPGVPGVPGMPGVGNNPAGGASLDFDAGLAGMTQSLTQQVGGGAGAAGMLSMVFSIVYPSLKPLLEASIRRVTVNIKWREGLKERELPLVQYVSNPVRAGFAQGVSMDGGVLSDGGGAPLPGQGGGTPGAPTGGGTPFAPSPFGGGAPVPRPGLQ